MLTIKRLLLPGFFSLVILMSLTTPKSSSIGVEPAVKHFRSAAQDFAASTLQLQSSITVLRNNDPESITAARAQLQHCRQQYKRIEFFLEYFFKSSAIVYNSPAKYEIEEPYMEYQTPIGLQVIEGLLYDDSVFAQKEQLLQEVDAINSSAQDLPALLYNFTADDKQLMESVRLELVRVYALGISGFDAPFLKSGVAESYEALQALKIVLTPFLEKHTAHADSVMFYMDGSLQALQSAKDFDSFDRLHFFSRYALPLQRAVGALIREMDLFLNTTDGVLNYDAEHLFSKDAINIKTFPSSGITANVALIKLGKLLFSEPALSGNNKVSCATCHRPEKQFTDGLTTSMAFNGHSSVKRNAPSLLYAAFQYGQFWDGRAKSLEEQAIAVMNSPDEMNGDDHAAIGRLMQMPVYEDLFRQAFKSLPVTSTDSFRQAFKNETRFPVTKPDNSLQVFKNETRLPVTKPDNSLQAFKNETRLPVTKPDSLITLQKVSTAIAAFVRTLAPRNSAFDRYMTGDTTTMNAAQVRGFNLFMGKAQCGTCHFVPLFNGLTPPLYNLSELEVLGTPKNEDLLKPVADTDRGRFDVFSIEFYQQAFKTPTVRNASLTAPYMHNGAFTTLENVVEFYNQGGGNGIGLETPTQTLSSMKLNLTKEEVKDVADFIRALEDPLPETGNTIK